jgi:hypothetical protein
VNEIAEPYWQACEQRVTCGRLKAYTLHRSNTQRGVQREKLRPDNPRAITELPEIDRHSARQTRFSTLGSVRTGPT